LCVLRLEHAYISRYLTRVYVYVFVHSLVDDVLSRNSGRGATSSLAQRSRPTLSASQRIDRSGYALRHSRPGVRQVGLVRNPRAAHAQGARPAAVRLSGGSPATPRRKRRRRFQHNDDETSDEEWQPDQQEESDAMESVQVESNISNELR
jgi:hypothetical protein